MLKISRCKDYTTLNYHLSDGTVMGTSIRKIDETNPKTVLIVLRTLAYEIEKLIK